MKLDFDCIRDILLTLEKYPYGEVIQPEQLFEELSNYDPEVISYSLLKLYEADYIEAHIPEIDGVFPEVSQIFDITFQGHEFLDNIRSNKIWTKTKSILSELGSGSIKFASQIAVAILTELIKQLALTP